MIVMVVQYLIISMCIHDARGKKVPRLIDARQASFSALRNANLSESPSVHASSVTRSQDHPYRMAMARTCSATSCSVQRTGQKDDAA